MSNDFKAFGVGVGANVLSQSAYVALTALIANGFSSGIAESEQLNKVWRQSSVIAYVIGQFISDELGATVQDNGDLATLLTQFKNAIAAATAAAAAGVTVPTAGPTATIGSTNNANRFICTAAVAFTLAASTTLSTGFTVTIDTIGGAATVAIDAGDHVNGAAGLGGTIVIPKGREARITTDGSHNIYISSSVAIGTVASSATVDLGALASSINTVTGITGITSFGATAPAGARFTCIAGGLFGITSSSAIIVPGGSVQCQVNDVFEVLALGSGNYIITSYSSITGQKQTEAGQCRIDLSSTNLLLYPFNGNKMMINGALVTIPDAGVTLAPTGLTANTLYYIYAYLSSGVLTLEASTTAYAKLNGYGYMIKNGDQTRTLVGMAGITASIAWADAVGQRWVKSWFNRRQISSETNAATQTITTSAQEFGATRALFLAWAGEGVFGMINGAVNGTMPAGCSVNMYIGVDGNPQVENFTGNNDSSGRSGQWAISCIYAPFGLSEGFHYMSSHAVTQSGSQTYIGATTVVMTTN